MKKPGEISEPIQVQTSFHILYLEKITKPQEVEFEKVKDELGAALRSRKLRNMKQQLRAELIRKAKIVYVNPVLRAKAGRQTREIHREPGMER